MRSRRRDELLDEVDAEARLALDERVRRRVVRVVDVPVLDVHGALAEEPRRRAQPGARVVPDPEAPVLWARFYELGTDRPIFIGRDKVIRYALAEIERERRAGYGYYNGSAASLLKTNYAGWMKRLHRGDDGKSSSRS